MVEQYRGEGYLSPIRVLKEPELNRFRWEFENLERAFDGKVQDIRSAHLYMDWAYELATHPRICNVAEAILGPDVIVLGTLIITKYPSTTSTVCWHQDKVFAGLGETPALTVWVALEDSTAENGCMQVLPNSHHRIYPHRQRYLENNMLAKDLEVDMEVELGKVVPLELKAGELSVHHPQIIHGSGSNSSERKRVGFTIKFGTPAVHWPTNPLVHARGDMDCSHLDLFYGPPKMGTIEGVQYWKAATSVPKQTIK